MSGTMIQLLGAAVICIAIPMLRPWRTEVSVVLITVMALFGALLIVWPMVLS